MRFNVVAVLFLACCTVPTVNSEELVFSYSYAGEIRPDFSKIRRGPLRVADFSDSRTGIDPKLLTDQNLGAGNAPDGYSTDSPVAAIVQDAITQGLVKGNATLVASGENLLLEGRLVSVDAQLASINGSDVIRLSIRTEVKLQGAGRTLWQTVLFGRGTAPVEEGMAKALTDALDRTIRSLVQDDYFLNEIL